MYNLTHFLADLLDSSKKEHFLYPIFIPSKERHGATGPRKFLCHIPILDLMNKINVPADVKRIPITPSNCLEKESRTIIFLVVEEEELDLYKAHLKGKN